jgi:hypothetical protein
LAAVFAVAGLAYIAHGGQESRRRGRADPGQRQQALGICSRSKECEGLVEPEWCWRQGLDQVACAGEALALVKARGVLATKAGLGSVIEAVEGLRAPLPTALAGLPRFEDTWAAVAQDRCGWGIGWQEASSRRLRQVLHEWGEGRQREGNGGAQVVAQVAAPLLEGHVPRHQAVGSLECWITGNGQPALARAQ